MKLNIQNIYNNGRKIYLFLRNADGSLSVKSDNSYHPYFFKLTNDIGSIYRAYDGTPLKKIPCLHPSEIYRLKTHDSFGSDIQYTKKYIIDKVDEFTQSPIKWAMIDIECLTKDGNKAIVERDPVSCITLYNSFDKTYNTWFLLDFEGTKKQQETQLLNGFIAYLKLHKFDMLLGWNWNDFDYPYLSNRVFHRYKKDFSKMISPIEENRRGDGEVKYPAGLSQVDYMGMYRKVEKKKSSYALEHVMEDELGAGKEYDNVDFSLLNEDIKLRNIGDVKGMVALEEKKKLIPYYDQIRRFARVDWEDLPMRVKYLNGKMETISNNSKIIDMLILTEAKKMNIILPDKRYDKEKEAYQGAKRDTDNIGRFRDIAQFDLGSAYPQVIIDYCLDTQNISEDEGIDINGTKFIQNKKALLPSVTKDLLAKKNELKKLKENTLRDDPNFENISTLYDAIKSICNSVYGVFALSSFRLYDIKVASTITYLVRGVLGYCINKLKEEGYDVIYADTDGCKIRGKENLTPKLNNYIQEWSLKNFGKNIELEFDFEGYYETIFIKALCKYVGYLRNDKGLEKRTKGVETVSANATKFVKRFQKEFIDKILELEKDDWKYSREDLIEWVKDEIGGFRKWDFETIGFPCKLAREQEDYIKTTPIFLRALWNTQTIFPNFNKQIGQRYYWLHVIPAPEDIEVTVKTEIHYQDYEKIILDEDKSKPDAIKWLVEQAKVKKPGVVIDIKKVRVLHKKTVNSKDVLAFDRKHQNHIGNVDWQQMIQKNIVGKVKPIFENLNWSYGELIPEKKRRVKDVKK